MLSPNARSTVSAALAGGSADKVAEPAVGADRGAIEWGYEGCACKVGWVVLDEVNRGQLAPFKFQCQGYWIADVVDFAQIVRTVDDVGQSHTLETAKATFAGDWLSGRG